MVFYPSFHDQAKQLSQTFDNLPKAAVQLFGGSSDFFSPVGYLNSQIFFLMLPLLLTMLAVALGSSLIAREEQDGTLQVLLARPVSRTGLLLAKIAAGTVVLGIVALVGMITVVLSAKLFDLDQVSSAAIAGATFNSFLLAYSTGAIAFLLAATGRARGAAIGAGALIGFGGYLISSLSGTVEWLKVPAKIFPFDYFQSEAILRGTYHWVNALFFVGVAAICGILSYIAFRRRDLVG
jgi:ABC-2 type transport system permease protein